MSDALRAVAIYNHGVLNSLPDKSMIMTYSILAIPLLLNILAILFYRRWFRIVAILVLPFTTLAAIFDGYSFSQRGNLTGLVTLFISGPALIGLVLLGLGSLVHRLTEPRPTSDHPDYY